MTISTELSVNRIPSDAKLVTSYRHTRISKLSADFLWRYDFDVLPDGYSLEVEYISGRTDGETTRKILELENQAKMFKEFRSIPPNFHRVVNRVITLTDRTLSEVMINYLASIKKDGKRNLILLKNKSTISVPDEIVLPDHSGKYNGTILDAEIIGDVVYPFDILFYRGTDVRNLEFRFRRGFLDDVLRGFPAFRKPEFVKIERAKELYERKYDFPIDGIILTSITGSYYANVYKWKERQTFDFLVRNIKSGTCDLLCRKQGELMIFARNAPYRADIPFENERVYEFFAGPPWSAIKEREEKTKLMVDTGYLGPNDCMIINDSVELEKNPVRIWN